MTICFELPSEIERDVRGDGSDVGREAREAYLVDLYRRERITHCQLAEALGLGRYEADGVLKRHGVGLEITVEEMRAEAEALRGVGPG